MNGNIDTMIHTGPDDDTVVDTSPLDRLCWHSSRSCLR